MGSRQPGRYFFYLGILLSFSVILAWLITRDWQNLLPTWWQVVILLLSIVLVSLRYLIPALKGFLRKRIGNPIPPVLQRKSIDDLLAPLGRGGRVNYIFRSLVDSNDLINHRHLLITGEIGSGKTRTAIELIRRLVLEGVISSQGIYIPDPSFPFLDRAELKSAVERIQEEQPVQLLFLDNLPSQVLEASLDQLTELLIVCEPALVITTARVEDLWEPLHRWLEKEAFLEIRLQELKKVQVSRLVDLANGVFGIQINETAGEILSDHLAHLPGRLLIAFQRLANREKNYITPDLVLPHTLGNLVDSFFAERTRLFEQDPGMLFIIESMAYFRSCRLQANSLYILKFAEKLRRLSRPQSTFFRLFRPLPSLRNSIPSLRALDINTDRNSFEAAQIVLENLTNPQIAYQKLEPFFLNINHHIPDPIKKRLASNASQQAWNLFLLGCAAQTRKDYDQSISLFSKAIRIYPHAWFLTHRSDVYAAQKNISAAVQDANRAIQLDSKSARAFTIRANFLLMKNEFSLAIDDYSRAIELDPKEAQAWLNRGNAYFAQEDMEKAVADFDTALELSPGLPAAVIARGKAHNVRGQLDQAIADYNEALVINPEDVQLLYSRASAYDSIKDYPRAIAEYDKLIALNPKDSQAYYNRGKAYHMLGNLENAVIDYEQSILANPRSAIAYRNRANALIRLNRLMEAKSDCREAERLEPNHPYTHARWGQYFAAREDYIGAIEKYNLASRLIGDPTHFNLDIALCLILSGNSTQGLVKIKERLKKGVKQDEIQEALRDFQAQSTQHTSPGLLEALKLLREASAKAN
jgi:tetratricopeptide (TPR) repeat protein